MENFIRMATNRDLAMLNRTFYRPDNPRWSDSSPQHVTGDVLARLFPLTFFDDFFTIVRHPVNRFVSAFYFHRNRLGNIPPTVDIDEFVDNIESFDFLSPGTFDNHFLPQERFLYPGAEYEQFRFEDGLDHVKDYLGGLFNRDFSQIPLPHVLDRKRFAPDAPTEISPNLRKFIEETYATDFAAFNY